MMTSHFRTLFAVVFCWIQFHKSKLYAHTLQHLRSTLVVSLLNWPQAPFSFFSSQTSSRRCGSFFTLEKSPAPAARHQALKPAHCRERAGHEERAGRNRAAVPPVSGCTRIASVLSWHSWAICAFVTWYSTVGHTCWTCWAHRPRQAWGRLHWWWSKKPFWTER